MTGVKEPERRRDVGGQGYVRDEQMSDADDPWIDRDFEAAVRDTAYFLWENDGCPHGREKEYWFTALDKCLRQREADAMLAREPMEAEQPDQAGPPRKRA